MVHPLLPDPTAPHLCAANASSLIAIPGHAHPFGVRRTPYQPRSEWRPNGQQLTGQEATGYYRTYRGDHVLLHVPLDPTGEAPVDSVASQHADALITATETEMTYEVVEKNIIILRERCAVQHNQFQESTNTCHFIITNNKWTLGSW